MGTVMAPVDMMATSAMIHSAQVSARMETRSPGFTPRETRPSATSRTRRPSSFQDMVFHAPPRLNVSAAASPRRVTWSSNTCTRFLVVAVMCSPWVKTT